MSKDEMHYTVRGRGNFTMPPKCSDAVAEYLSPLSVYGFSRGEVQEAGRKVYARLREMMQREAVLAVADRAEVRGQLKEVKCPRS